MNLFVSRCNSFQCCHHISVRGICVYTTLKGIKRTEVNRFTMPLKSTAKKIHLKRGNVQRFFYVVILLHFGESMSKPFQRCLRKQDKQVKKQHKKPPSRAERSQAPYISAVASGHY